VVVQRGLGDGDGDGNGDGDAHELVATYRSSATSVIESGNPFFTRTPHLLMELQDCRPAAFRFS
jgi:hypothetical protein